MERVTKNIISFYLIGRCISLYVMIYDKTKQNLILSSSIMTIFWNVHEKPDKKNVNVFQENDENPKSSDAGPHLKAPYWNRVITSRYVQLIWDNTRCTVTCIYDHLKNNNNFKSLFFYDDRYLPLLVLLMSWLYRQYVLLRCDQVCFVGATILKNNKLKSLITQ